MLLQLVFRFIPSVLGEVEVFVLCRPANFSSTRLGKPFLYGPCFVHTDIVMLKQKRALPKLLRKAENKLLLKISLYAVCVEISLHWN